MIELVGIYSFQERHLVGNAREVWQVIGDIRAGLTALFKDSLRSEHFRDAADERETFAFEERWGAKLVVEFLKLGFIIEELKLGGGSRHMHVDHAPGLAGEMRWFGRHRVECGDQGIAGGLLSAASHEARQRSRAEPGSTLEEKVPAGNVFKCFEFSIVVVHNVKFLTQRRKAR